MSASDQVPKIKYSDTVPKLDKYQLEFMKIIEQENLSRVSRLLRIRRNNIITGAVLGGCVLGIYAYSILSVKQERFLDDFEVPKKVSDD